MADKCDDCSKHSDRTCLKCHKLLCYLCCFDHELYNTGHYCKFPPLQMFNTSCKQHYYDPVRGFCYECNELVCVYCQQESHIKHHIGQIDDVAREKRTLVGKEISKCEQKAEQIKKQLEQRQNNHNEINEKVKLLKVGRKKASVDSLVNQKLPSVLDPRQNEKLSQLLQEIKSLKVLQNINNELLRNLKHLSTNSQYTPVWFLCGYVDYRKHYEHIVFPSAVNDHFIPLNFAYNESGDEVQPRTTRRYERMEHFRPIYTDADASALEPLAERRNQDTIISNLPETLKSKVADMKSAESIFENISKNTRQLVEACNKVYHSVTLEHPGSLSGHTEMNRKIDRIHQDMENLQRATEKHQISTESNLEQISKNTRLLVELCNNKQSNVIMEQPIPQTGQLETNKQIKRIHKDMENVLSYVKNTSEEIQRVETKLKKSQNRVAALEDRERSSSNLQRLENTQRKEVQRLEAELQKSQDRVAQLEDRKEVQKLEAELQKWRIIAIQQDERRNASSNQEREESNQRKEVQRLEAELQKWRNYGEQQEERWETSCKEKESLNRQVKRIENEKEDLKTRLSQVAGAKLTAGNSAITDLGDRYRPTRIAEMYSELYDTEWTEAMDDILQSNKWSEDSIVQHMFIVLQICFNACKRIACDQLTELCNHLFPGVQPRDMENYMDTHVTEVKQLKDARKGTASVVGKMLSKSLIDSQDIRNECMKYNDVNSLIIDEIMKTSYGTTCITVCWFMVVQDPEMCLDEHLKKGDIFNKDVYKEYTRSGKKVAYSVWPALYLHKDGPLLTKGVAQAFN